MKNKKINILLSILLITSFISCSNDDDSISNGSNNSIVEEGEDDPIIVNETTEEETPDETTGEETPDETTEEETPGETTEEETPVAAGKFAFIMDTSDDSNGKDTGELKLNLDETIQTGMITVSVNKGASELDAFINLSGTSTTRSNALIDMRLRNDSETYQFTESGENVTILSTPEIPTVVNDEFVNITIWWDATGDSTPLVEVFVDKISLTGGPFASEGGLNNSDASKNDPNAIAEGVSILQFRFGGGSDIEEAGIGFAIDNINIYNNESGTPVLIFSDDFESYTTGYSLDPDAVTINDAPMPNVAVDPNTPYSANSFDVIVGTE